MGTNNRQRRKEKQFRLKNKKQNKIQGVTSDGLGMQVLENPFADLSKDDRKNIIDEMKNISETDYGESLEKLQEIFRQYNPVVILSFMAHYGLVVGIGTNKVENYDRKITQAHVEICQALMLQIKIENVNYKTPFPEIMQDILDLSQKLLQSSLFKNLKSSILDLPSEEAYIEKVKIFIISHTQTVRNWGNSNQVKKISNEIYSKFDTLLKEKYNFSASEIISFFDYLVKTSECNNTKTYDIFRDLKKINNVEKMIYRYHKLIDSNELEAENLVYYLNKIGISSQPEALMILRHHYSDCYLPKNYIFNYCDVAMNLNINKEIITSIVECFSYRVGDLESFKTDHIFLSNPIWTKPIILLSENEFFCPIPRLFFSFIFKSLDGLIEKFDEKKLSEIKSDYLENKIETIVKSRFSEANTVKSVKWKGFEDGLEKEFETDLIAFVDTYAIIFEAKSGKITDPALRGSPDRLKKKINELLIEPNIQSKRLQEKLEYLIDNPNIYDELREKLPINLEKTKKILRVSVTLEYFASLQSNIYGLKATGWIPGNYNPCPTMNIADFETLFDIFDNPIQIINYLEMREEIEGVIKYDGDELDLMSVYMENHLNFKNVNFDLPIYIKGMSKKIDDYYQLVEYFPQTKKPKLKMNKYFEKIVAQIEERKSMGWLQFGSILYRLNLDEQLMIVNSLEKIKKNVRKKWQIEGHHNILIYIPSELSRYSFAFAVFCDNNKQKRHDFLEDAIANGLKAKHIDYCLGIGINIDRTDVSYIMITLSANNRDDK